MSEGDGPPWMSIAAAAVGLPVALWSYKCLMLVVFQRRIIYMGGLPPGARAERVNLTCTALGQFRGQHVAIQSAPDVTLRGIQLSRPKGDTVLVYFQGNLGSPVQRIPLFSGLLSHRASPFSTIIAIPPRSFYLSTNVRPTQAGLTEDYLAVLRHARASHPGTRVVLYGHSLGGSAACCALASLPADGPRLVDALILENAFPSIPVMISRSLYPSRLLPYHYLAPLALDRWDAHAALRQQGTLLSRTPILFISGADDTLVRPALVKEMHESTIRSHGEKGAQWVSVKDASHDDCWTKGDWWRGVETFLK